VAEFTDEDDALLEALEIEVEDKATSGWTPREERIVAGFREVQRFVDQNGAAPEHGEGKDIFERLYAVRLDRLRALAEARTILEPLDRQELLRGVPLAAVEAADDMDDDALLAELGVVGPPDGIADLRHVRSTAEKRAAEEIGNRKTCEDFEEFKPMFLQIKTDLDTGIRRSRPFESMDQIQKGQWFIVGGQIAYVADVGEEFVTEYDRRDRRLRVIYGNGTESVVLLRSLQRALHRDGAGRAISDPDAGPLFSGEIEEGDETSGTIYVLRSKSENPAVAANRDVLHKIGVTGGSVTRRIDGAKLDPTFLLADVEVVATYKLSNINRTKLEALIHRIFDPVRLKIEIKDRFGIPVVPREWFLVPLFVIDEAVARIKDGTITDYRYEPSTASLQRIGN
jgi:hypothetical protein